MSFAIMGGLAVATVLTLISLPSLYINWFKIREQKTPDPRSADPRSAEQNTLEEDGAGS
jgi:hypothetical protein